MVRPTNSKAIIDSYLEKTDWRVKENSNATHSFGALGKHIITEVTKDYWLRSVYPEHIAKAYVSGDIHIHDLGALTVYCCGYSLESIIRKGVRGVPNIPTSSPAKHFDSILNQVANLTTVFQNEIAGAVAFNMVDTLLAPFIKVDGLSYNEVKQSLQNFIFSINSNSRGGAEPAFSNITLDITPAKDMLNKEVVIGGDTVPGLTYKDCQAEMDMFNKAFCEVMLEGDSNGNAFSYPIPTYNIHQRFNWETDASNLIFDMAGKFGYPYFANFINSDMAPEDIRSMCCRLSLDLSELSKRNGGLFGSGDSTGSIGVVTLNLARYGYLAISEEHLFADIEKNMILAKDSLVIKRDFLQKNVLEAGLIPAFQEYVGTLHNHFSTIGLIGMNEMCVNFLGKDITTQEGLDLSKRVLEFMNAKLIDFQKETGVLFNLEATPAESTSYSLAIKDKKLYPDCFTQGKGDDVYYTNSTNIPVKDVESISMQFDHQDKLVPMYTGGSVVHVFLDGPITGVQAKSIIKSACDKYRVPYISLSPINRYCKEHGFVEQRTSKCPSCGSELELMQRVTGYLRAVKNFNKGKTAEFHDRVQANVT